MDAATLRDALIACLTAGRCELCGIALLDEAVAHAETVLCPDCSRLHGAGRRAHAVWRPGTARLLLGTDAPDVDGP